MRRQRIYIDTSVIGGCCDEEFAVWSKGLMRDFEFGLFRPVISELVTAEIADAPGDVQDVYGELLDCDPEFAERTEESDSLARLYVERGILTEKFSDDAVHVALATVAEVDLLVSWNFRHVVHEDKIRRFSAVNLELGYRQIPIYSPREVTHHGD